jgi:hypothetical protein
MEHRTMAEKAVRDAVRLVIPLDASAIEGFEPDRPVRVLAVDAADQPLAESQIAKFDAKGQAVVTFNLARRR